VQILLLAFILALLTGSFLMAHEHHQDDYDHEHYEHKNHHHDRQLHSLKDSEEDHTQTEAKHDTAKPSTFSVWAYSLASSFGVSLLSFAGASLLFYGNKNAASGNLQFILSCVAVGSLLGDCFLHLMPILYTTSNEHDHNHHSEHVHGGKHSHSPEVASNSFVILFGFMLCLFLEVYLRIKQKREEAREEKRDSEEKKTKTRHHHSHIKAVGWLNLIGDAIHNFMDGAGIAGAFQVSIPVGVANVLCICMHEIPQELSDYGILLGAGFSVKNALFFNFLSGVLSVVGCLFGLFVTSGGSDFQIFFLTEKHLVALSAGSFLYIATSLIPSILDQMVESETEQPPTTNEDRKEHGDQFITKLIYAVSGVTFGILIMHIIGVYEDSVMVFVSSMY